jgi:L-alanine-DL-glutamate epimerase-like enolase superfamily enzyme
MAKRRELPRTISGTSAHNSFVNGMNVEFEEPLGLLREDDILLIDTPNGGYLALYPGSSGRTSATVTAISGVELALWDLIGHKLKTPVYNLMGGRFRNAIRMYADCHAGEGLASLSCILAPRIPWWMSASGETESFLEIHAKYHGGRAEEAFNLDLEGYPRRAQEAVSLGYSALKFDLDLPLLPGEDLYARTISAVIGRRFFS